MKYIKADTNDRILVDLIKKIDLEEPSIHFVDKVLTQYSQQPKFVKFRIARLPLFIITGLFILLIVPIIFTSFSEIKILYIIPVIFNIIHDFMFELTLWNMFFPAFLLWTIILIVQLEMRSKIFIDYKK